MRQGILHGQSDSQFIKQLDEGQKGIAAADDGEQGEHGWVMGASVAHTPYRSPQFRVHDHVHDEVGATAT